MDEVEVVTREEIGNRQVGVDAKRAREGAQVAGVGIGDTDQFPARVLRQRPGKPVGRVPVPEADDPDSLGAWHVPSFPALVRSAHEEDPHEDEQ